jgi:hypothetical protein
MINNLKTNTYLNMPRIFKDFEMNIHNNQNMTIEEGNEYYKNTMMKLIDRSNNIMAKSQKNNSSSNLIFNDQIKLKNDKIRYKNKNYKNIITKIRPNFSSDFGNNRSNLGFSSSNNSLININNINTSINKVNNRNKLLGNKNTNESPNNYYNYDYLKNMQIKNNLDKLDNNINVNEKIISSPFQAYQVYQKKKKEADYKIGGSIGRGKNNLFENKNNYKNVNNNNYQNNYLNFKGKEAELIQNLVNNIQSNIPNYEENYIDKRNFNK